MKVSRVVEYVFFFGLLALAGYAVWLIAAPFVSVIALSAIVVTICYPAYQKILSITPRQNKTVASLMTTFLVMLLVILPLVMMSLLITKEVLDLYQSSASGQEFQIQNVYNFVDGQVGRVVPGFHLDVHKQLESVSGWLVSNLDTIFAGTVSTIFLLALSILGSFYFFKDGEELMKLLIKASPLPDDQDKVVFERMARAVRAVATGTLLLALIQGTVATIGFLIFGVPHPFLWGTLASMGALMPGIGTSIATIPASIYLLVTGSTVSGIGMLLWGVLAVGLIDNLLGPYLIGKRNNMHPFVILIAVLGGLNLFGPVGFIVGPVVVTLFFVLLEIYNQYIIKDKRVPEVPKE